MRKRNDIVFLISLVFLLFSVECQKECSKDIKITNFEPSVGNGGEMMKIYVIGVVKSCSKYLMCQFGDTISSGELKENEKTIWVECKIPPYKGSQRVEIKLSQNSGKKWTEDSGKKNPKKKKLNQKKKKKRCFVQIFGREKK